jgi:hypothetical protein
MANVMADLHIKLTRALIENFDPESATPRAVTGRPLLGTSLRFQKYAPHQLAIGVVFHKLAADPLRATTSSWLPKDERRRARRCW